ncbi:MAG TPA: NYN domain-containing protein [Ktedonobacteraceae bacterium]
MTTQNIEPENSDVNETVVQQSSASETPATSAFAETEVATPAYEQVTQTPEKQVDEESVRPFTDYIEEFRQKEVRFDSLLEEPQVEPFSSLISGEEQGGSQFTPGWANTPFGESTLLEGASFAVEDVEARAGAQNAVSVESNGNVVEKPSEPAMLPEPGQVAAQQQESPAAEAGAASLTEHPVSPLLRPASRIRLPRQGSSRHREEPVRGEQAPQKPEGETTISTSSSVEDTSQTEGAPGESTKPAPVETTPVVEQPRPERRYRFDRRTPAASAPVQARAEESKGSPAPLQAFPRTHDGHVGEREEQAAQQSKQSAGVVQPIEQPAPLQAVVQEQVVTHDAEAAKGKPAKVTHDGRRRHGQERQREKAQATPAASTPAVTEVAAPVAEVSEPQAPEVALEDLPPLEYAELQAASSRRRRRRRPGSASPAATAPNVTTPVAAKPLTPDQAGAAIQTPSPVAPVAVPRTIAVPGSPVPSAGQYSILSGHTVSQMNQGNDVSGPFMGPEPSPARGSTVSRTVRPIRNEAQRIPTYPARPEVGPSSTSISHLANVVAQAIQTQSDRMVAELRRANQIPTNVSVSLPPFPSTERVGVFVDVANLLYSARTQRLTIDFGKLLDFLRGNRRLVRAHAYCPTSPQPGDDQMFLQAVKGLGYRITTKNYKTFSSGAKKADLDLDLCMDVVRLVDGKAVDCIVLVSGDSDFMPMLDYCSDHGVRVEVAAFDESMSATLRQSCDLFVNLSMLEEIRA